MRKVFQTNVESLFMEKSLYFLGIDGGGTKTDLALADIDGNIVRTHKTDSCNPIDIGLEKGDKVAQDILKRNMDEVVKLIKTAGNSFENSNIPVVLAAGTSGRLGVIDAAECPPTYGVSAELISGIIAGGYDRMVSAGESTEDNGEMGIKDLSARNLTPNDTVLGISVAGNAAYVADALLHAKSLGCLTVGLTCNEGSRLDKETDISIVTDTGAEVVTGSTRMKAGSAHKMVLNMISTCVMIKMGNVYQNMMINLKPNAVMVSIICTTLLNELYTNC